MAKRKRYTDLDQFWREAPQKLKNQVKGDITERGYNVDPTGGTLSAHLWESGQWDVSHECCAELIAHYAEVKRKAVERSEDEYHKLSTKLLLNHVEQGAKEAWNRIKKELEK